MPPTHLPIYSNSIDSERTGLMVTRTLSGQSIPGFNSPRGAVGASYDASGNLVPSAQMRKAQEEQEKGYSLTPEREAEIEVSPVQSSSVRGD